MYDFLCLTPIWIIFLTADVSGVITNAPSNGVAEVGGQATYNCTSDTTLQNWVFSTSVNIAINCAIQPGFTTHYEVDRPGGSNNICNLIVKATTMQQAGIYTCTDTEPGPFAILTVIDPIPVITSSTTAAVEGETVMFQCVLNYNGSVSPAPTLRPHFYWTNSSGQNVTSSSDLTTGNMVVSQLAVTAGRQNIAPYTCHVHFLLIPPIPPNYAANTPTVNSSATSSTIEVIFPPLPATTPSSTLQSTSATSNLSNSAAISAAIALGVQFFISLFTNAILLI